MSEDADLRAWVTLARTPRLDTTTLAAALERLGGAARLVAGSPAAWQAAGLSAAACGYLDGGGARPRRAELRWLEQAGHHLVPFSHPKFPPLLRQAAGCPIALYVDGNPQRLVEPKFAVVGTRNPTPQGRNTAHLFAAALSTQGLCIISGLAQGIDTAAHLGALEAGGVTVAVLGNGLDRVYPRCNSPLSERISRSGALVSEFAPGTPPRPGHFPRRNRLMAGMSLGTLVVEAALRSGSLITARMAADRGRDVFAVPGSILSPMSRGCHALIKDGAKLVETPGDILSELSYSGDFRPVAGPAAAAAGPAATTAGMDKDRKILLDALGFDPENLDVLVVRTGFKPEAVSSMMLILELEGHVQAAPGGRYSRVANRRAGGER